MNGDQLAALTLALNGPVQSVRIAAVGQLASLRTAGAASALIAVLNDDNGVVAERAFRRLKKLPLGREHVAPLIHLAEQHTFARIPALTLLAPLADDERVPPVFVRMIADGIWRFDGYDEISKALARNGRSMVFDLCALLDSSDESVRRLSFSALAEIGDERALDRMLEHLATVGDQERSDMSYALRKMGPAAGTLAAAMRHPNPVTRAAVARRLADPADIPILDLVLRDADPAVRLAAASVLSTARTNAKLSTAHRPLIERMLANPDPGVRRAACEVAFGLPANIVCLLTPLLSDEDPSVRSEAVKVLGWCRRPELLPVLGRALLDEADWVRVEAAKALKPLAGEAALPVEQLIALLDDRERFARYAAVQVLGALKERRAVPALCQRVFDPDDFVPTAAAKALGAIGDEAAVPTLDRALTTADELTRRAAARALVAIGTPAAFDALTAAARRGPDYAVITALTYSRDPKALPALEVIAASDVDWAKFASLRYSVDMTLQRLRSVTHDDAP